MPQCVYVIVGVGARVENAIGGAQLRQLLLGQKIEDHQLGVGLANIDHCDETFIRHH